MPRLSKGEISPGIRSKAEAARCSAACRVKVFNDLTESNDKLSPDWLNFRDVESFSCWKKPSAGIEPLSPKTLRKYMAELYSGGLVGILTDANKFLAGPVDRAVEKSTGRVTSLEKKVSAAVDSALEMTVRYLDLLEKIQKLAQRNESARMELERHFRRYGHNPHLKVIK
ncbi:hypothetical protein [Pseudomonas rubra]|uniref:Uncharacterized protein n=1 Tax=Pseudomonas rubra TaxID=2942627 RepID=A0ABT5PCP9_9PSED|nr:hypothetical protein [Pseudomonas rubra]MDD1016078.1 hypothetical protein [Pseudomonas rubra]MDD1039999.1 hypothetical protein [Pseudomonas rubra]MDD1156298.1 hypothetical protein [Pseudomonas rubra]